MNHKNISKDLLSFIQKCPSSFHTIHTIRQMLSEHEFHELSEKESWNLEKGNSYFVTRNNSSLIAFTIPANGIEKYHIIATHSDFPAFKIKENPEIAVENHYIKLNVEKYGGMLMAPWLDLPLSVAGRIIVRKNTPDNALQISDATNLSEGISEHASISEGIKNDSKIFEEILVDVDRDLILIPNLAIHMNREANDGYKYNAQKDMLPLFGDIRSKDQFMQIIAETANVPNNDILGHDLYLYNRQSGTIWGANEEFISAPRLDDLQCTYGAMEGFLAGQKQQAASLLCIFDNEEVGSSTKQGAASTFLTDTINRIQWSLQMNPEEVQIAKAKSFMISADNAHAVHPNHPDKADPVNRPYLNEGIVIKFNSNQRYCTDAVSAAYFKNLCETVDVPIQTYANRSDIAGGSTLGNISNNQFAVNTVDIGLPQLAMHSPYETAGVKDTGYLIKAITKFFN